MASGFARIDVPENLHDRVTRTLALKVIQAERESGPLLFPNEAGLCQQLGISRSILREAIKVLADKGMVEVRPRSGTKSRPRTEWNLLDPDIVAWQAQLSPDARFLRDLCEVRLALEPTASGFAAVRATPGEIDAIEDCLARKQAKANAADPAETIEPDLEFHAAVVAASHNPMFQKLSAIIRQPFRTALSYTVRLRASEALGEAAYRALVESIRSRDPLKARAASEEIVGWETWETWGRPRVPGFPESFPRSQPLSSPHAPDASGGAAGSRTPPHPPRR